MNQHENPKYTCVREIKEEISLDVTNIEFVCLSEEFVNSVKNEILNKYLGIHRVFVGEMRFPLS